MAKRGTPGFIVGELENLCGVRANPVGSIRLNGCRVPRDHLLDREGNGLVIGLAAIEEAIQYAKQSRTFGTALENHQAIQMMIAEMATQVEAARPGLSRACSRLSRSRTSGAAASWKAKRPRWPRS
jgi:alkylation response protein AidB-like acyl-CoA dehydrogenase